MFSIKKQNFTIAGSAATPACHGYAMPGEWETHEATWLGWPHNANDWPSKFETIPWVYGEMVRKISPGEMVRLLVRHHAEAAAARRLLLRVGCDLKKIEFILHPSDRGWTRDTGPVFVKKRNAARNASDTAIVHFHFNGWAKYANWRRDTTVPETAARLLHKKLFHATCPAARSAGTHAIRNFVIEGGGIEVNGRGTLLSTAQCYLDPAVQVRNPGLGKKEIEAALKEHLGVRNIFWLAKGPAGDDTHGHIDDVCRFVNRRTIVLVREKNRRDENYRPLMENWERITDLRLEDGTKPEIIALPMPSPLFFDRRRLPASYANFYICNACVIVPTFNDPNDRLALGILGELFADRPVVGIHAVDLVWGFGSLHCLTQQQPA
ncbi:MAG: agmatine deiminase family protein [Verrucomicrobia bacterium]|nr:agmatine deiminase family protein [Verrucomicrobiota bacterium]MDE3099295.1 agmatine deiminase family protein [Verrucomicrobiota bacterium]